MSQGKPLCVELFCGTFGWSQGWLEDGGMAVGFDIDHQSYHGPVPKGAHLVLQDVHTIDGAQFKDASLILASPPCQEFSYMAMPWKRSKQIAAALRGQGEFPEGYKGSRTVKELTALFDACFRIQREASAAAGGHIPMVVENVRGAIPWVGRSTWNFGSYHLWGDVPALMPMTCRGVKAPGGTTVVARGKVNRPDHTQVIDPERGRKGYAARLGDSQISRRHGSKSSARKAASAAIAKIPAPLARHIAQVYFPRGAA